MSDEFIEMLMGRKTILFEKILERYHELAYMTREKTQDEKYEWDVYVRMFLLLDVLRAFETGARQATKPHDLSELIHHLDGALSTIKHARGYFSSQCPHCASNEYYFAFEKKGQPVWYCETCMLYGPKPEGFIPED